MIEFQGVAACEERRQVSCKSQPCHSRSVTIGIVSSPTGFNGMQIVGLQRGAKQPMAAIDARVEQTDMGDSFAVGRVLSSSQQVFEPFALFVRPQGIEEVGCLLCTPQFGNAVERDYGASHLIDRRKGQQHCTLQESHLARSHAHSLCLGPLSENVRGGVTIAPNG